MSGSMYLRDSSNGSGESGSPQRRLRKLDPPRRSPRRPLHAAQRRQVGRHPAAPASFAASAALSNGGHGALGEPEVRKSDVDVLVEQKVGRLHVAVQEERLAALDRRVEVDEPARRVAEDAKPLAPREGRRVVREAEEREALLAGGGGKQPVLPHNDRRGGEKEREAEERRPSR